MKKEQHWSKMQERGTYIGMQTLLFVYRIFGRKILSFFLYPVVVYLYLSGGASKKASLKYWQRIAKIKGTPENINYKVGIKHFYSFAQSAFDKIDAWSGKIKSEDIIYDQGDPLAILAEKKQGAIFIGSHLGNLEVCRALGHQQHTTRINVLVFTHHAVEFNNVLNQINPNANVDLIQATDITSDLAILIKERIDNSEILVITGDRTSVNTPGRVFYQDFLGSPAPFSQGPFILASILDCPVYFLFCLKQNKKYRIVFEHIADSLKFPRKTRQVQLAATVQAYAQRLEYYCLQYPMQWFNFFDFWQSDQEVLRNNDAKKKHETLEN